MIRWMVATASVAMLLGACNAPDKEPPPKATKQAPTADETPPAEEKKTADSDKVTAEVAVEADLPVEVDFEAEADAQITDKNYKAELDKIEAAIGQ